MNLKPPPAALLPATSLGLPDADGFPRFGRFSGTAGRIDWSALSAPYARNPLWRRLHHKRWHYVALSTEQLFCGIAIVDVGWTNTAFAYAFDRRKRTIVASFSQDGIPGLTAHVPHAPGGASHFRFPGKRIRCHTADSGRQHVLELRCNDFHIDATFNAGSTPPLLAVGPVEGGSVHATQKSPGMPLCGEVRVKGGQYDLDGGVASVDYSNGLLARDTDWRWASAHGLDIGFNLQAGYFGGHENVLWLDGHLVPLGAAVFDYDRSNPMLPWHIRTEDGLLDLHFEPEGLRREDKNLLVAVSRYVQPIGSFSGWVKAAPDAPPREVRRLGGVTEDHFSRW